MVKFSNGMWWAADGVNIDWATESVKSEAKAQSIRCVAVRDPWYLRFVDMIHLHSQASILTTVEIH